VVSIQKAEAGGLQVKGQLLHSKTFLKKEKGKAATPLVIG
jgi:hypothetical protein